MNNVLMPRRALGIFPPVKYLSPEAQAAVKAAAEAS